MQTLDLILRFAAISQILLLAVLILRAHWDRPIAPFAALYLYGVISYLLCPVVGRDWDFGLWGLPFYIGCFGVAAAFWVFTRVLFDDAFRLRAYHIAAMVVVVAIGFAHHYGSDALLGDEANSAGRSVLDVVPQILSLGFIVLALAQAQLGRRSDLVESRRTFRDVLVGLSGAYMVIIVVTEIVLSGQAPLRDLETLNVGGIFAVTFGVSLFVLRVRPGLFAAERTTPEQRMAAPQSGMRDEALLADILRAVETERAYRQEGLTIAELAKQLGTQEYRLRRAINGGLGYRNFNAFLNHWRIREACGRLKDPAEDHLPVLTIAMDLGYRSLGPFNRAFKDETGMTPTEYRKTRAEGPAPAAEVPAPAVERDS